MAVEVQHFFHNDTYTLVYVLHSGPGTEAAVIDPVLDYNPASGEVFTNAINELDAFIKNQNLSVKYILETHPHADHLTGAKALQSRVGGKIGISHYIPQVQKLWSDRFNIPEDQRPTADAFDLLVKEGDELALNDSTITVMETPGHTPTCVTYCVDGMAFIGDTLFMPDYGTARADFPGGNPAQLYDSIQKILSLPDDTQLYTCHDYMPGGRELKFAASVAEQRTTNKHLDGVTDRSEFAQMRKERDEHLDVPRLIMPSLQVNIRGGELPTAEENGTRYVKIPLSGNIG